MNKHVVDELDVCPYKYGCKCPNATPIMGEIYCFIDKIKKCKKGDEKEES